MAMNLWELQRDPNWKDAASSTGGKTQSSVNYLMNEMQEEKPNNYVYIYIRI